MAEGLDTSAYPPMGPELVAPAVGWLAHESCSITGEMLVAIAGRVARAVYRRNAGRVSAVVDDRGGGRAASTPSATRRAPVIFPVVPDGHADHIRYSFGMAAQEPPWMPMQSSERTGPLARRARGRSHRDGDGAVLHPDHGRHGRGRDQDRAARGRQHPLHLGGPGARDERRVRQRQPRQAQRRPRPAVRSAARPPCARSSNDADVFIHSMRAKAIAKLGFGYDDVAAINPAIVYTNCYGYGRRGPDGDLPAYDDTIQAECGLPAVQQLLTGEANYVGTIMADKVAGLTALYATMMALFHRERTGEGQEVEVGMFETMASFMLVEHANGAMFDPPLGPAIYPRAVAPNRRPYRTKDGYIAALIYNDKQWAAFVEAVRPAWASDALATLEQRARQIDTVYALLAETFNERTTQEWLDAVPRARHTRRAAAHPRRAVRQSRI